MSRRLNQLPLFYLLATALTACGPGNVGGTGPATTTGADDGDADPDDGADEESGALVPDEVECSVPTCTNLTGQYDPAGCCEGLQPSENDDSACPSEIYPNNWTCDGSGNCVHGGCSSDSDCAASMMKCLDPEEDALTIGFCLTPCEDTPDSCNYDDTDMMCTGVAHDAEEVAYGYCRQHPFPE